MESILTRQMEGRFDSGLLCHHCAMNCVRSEANCIKEQHSQHTPRVISNPVRGRTKGKREAWSQSHSGASKFYTKFLDRRDRSRGCRFSSTFNHNEGRSGKRILQPSNRYPHPGLAMDMLEARRERVSKR